MRGLAPPAVVDPPAVAPPLHSLVTSAIQPTDPDNRWENGYEFCPEDCFTPHAWSAHCPDDAGAFAGGNVNKSDADDNPLCVTVLPVTIESAFECSSRGFSTQDYTGRARRQTEAATPNALESEFWLGTLIPENPALVRTTPNVLVAPGGRRGILNPGADANNATAYGVTRALALLNEGLAKAGPGARGMIHASPELVTLWDTLGVLKDDGPRLVTKVRGNIVVAGGGYPGVGPDGNAQAAPTRDRTWAYATGMVLVRVADVDVVPDSIAEALDRKTNTVTYRGERSASATWSTCTSLAVLVDMTS